MTKNDFLCSGCVGASFGDGFTHVIRLNTPGDQVHLQISGIYLLTLHSKPYYLFGQSTAKHFKTHRKLSWGMWGYTIHSCGRKIIKTKMKRIKWKSTKI